MLEIIFMSLPFLGMFIASWMCIYNGYIWGRHKGYSQAMKNVFDENDRIIDRCANINKELVKDFEVQMQKRTKMYHDHIHDLESRIMSEKSPTNTPDIISNRIS